MHTSNALTLQILISEASMVLAVVMFQANFYTSFEWKRPQNTEQTVPWQKVVYSYTTAKANMQRKNIFHFKTYNMATNKGITTGFGTFVTELINNL